MRTLFGHAITAVVLAGATTATDAQPEQQVHRSGFTPVGDEAFAVIREAYELDVSWPLDVATIESWDDDTARYETLVFTTTTDERVPGDLLLPLDGDGPFPTVLLLHGLGNDRGRWWEDDRRALPDRLVAGGVAVFAIDLRHHGARSVTNDHQNPVYLTLGNDLHVRSRDMLIQSTLDARRALALLRSRDDVDEDRLAVVGYSMGGMIAVTLGALEDLEGLVACAIPTGPQPALIDPFNVAPRVAVPTLLLVGRSDWLSSPRDVTMLHDLIPVDARELVLYDAGHRLPPAFVEEAARWLLDRLR